MRKTVLIDAFPDSALRHREGAAVACIDVMLTTTTLATAAAQGRASFVAASHDELRALTARLTNALAVGCLGGAHGELELPDGPCALLRKAEDARPIVLLSPPGTELIANAAGAGLVLLACFRNLSATASALAQRERVALLAAGCREEFSCEDQMAAAWIAERLLDRGFEAADRRTADIVRRWSGISPTLAGWGNSAAQLQREGRAEEVEFVIAHVDDLERPCRCERNVVRTEDVTAGSTAGGRGPLLQ